MVYRSILFFAAHLPPTSAITCVLDSNREVISKVDINTKFDCAPTFFQAFCVEFILDFTLLASIYHSFVVMNESTSVLEISIDVRNCQQFMITVLTQY